MLKVPCCNRDMHRKLEKVTEGQIYIDDFEGTRAGIDLAFST